MNENLEQNIETGIDLLPSNDGVSNDGDILYGNGFDTLPDGGAGTHENVDGDGYADSPHVWTCDTGSSNSSLYNGDSTFCCAACTEIVAQETQQTETLATLNHYVILIFMFLLLSWTEKKINVITNRFTSRKK